MLKRNIHFPVALFFYRLGDSCGGAERIICALANSLYECGFPVHLISWDNINSRTFFPLNQGINWHRLGFRNGLLDKFRRCFSLLKLLNDAGIRALVGFVMSGDKSVYTAAKLAGIRLIVAERNAPSMYYLRYNRFRRWITFIFLHLADRITVQFPEFTKGYPVSLRNRIEVIPNPVNVTSRYSRPDMPNAHGRYTLLAVSRLDNVQKRLDCLLRAFARISSLQPKWDLRIVGDGSGKNALRQLAKELGLLGRVYWDPSLTDIFEVYIQSNLFVMPSLWEGFPNALAEALSHGLPAIGFSQAAGVASLIEDGRTGWLAKGLDDELELARVLNQAIMDGKERSRRGALAVESMAAYVPDVQFERWARLLNRLAGKNTV